ncbi:hypothetical protein AALB52_16370 [Lachnospiraceae bacterium 38-14]
MRAEKNGFVLIIEGTWCEISNRYGVVEHGNVILPDEVSEDFAETMLDKFIREHSVRDFGPLDKDCIKRVAYDVQRKEYIQLQAVHKGQDDYWIVQKYDNELVYMGEVFSGCRYHDETLDWMRTNFDIESCLTAEVYRSSLGDCTNGGISAERRSLYIVAKTKGPFEPQDIRECVYIEQRDVMGSQYIDCKPLYFPKRWYMMGGNFLYTSDSRFREIAGAKYPIPIHDRYEGR